MPKLVRYVHIFNFEIISCYRIQHAHTKYKQKGKKGRLKALSVFGIDKTPLTEGNESQTTPLTFVGPTPAYDMTPINMSPPVNVQDDDNENMDKKDDDYNAGDDEVEAAVEEISESSEEEPSVNTNLDLAIDDEEKKESQTPINMIMGMIQKAALLVRLNTDDIEDKPKPKISVPLSQMTQRTRSYSDPTSVKVLAKKQAPTFKNLRDDTGTLKDERLKLDLNKMSEESDHSNKSAPGIDGKPYRYNVHYESMKSSSYNAKLLEMMMIIIQCLILILSHMVRTILLMMRNRNI